MSDNCTIYASPDISKERFSIHQSKPISNISMPEEAKEKLLIKLQREPTVEEIANELEITREEAVIALESIVDPVSLNEPIYSDGGDTIYIMDQVGDGNDERNWLEEIAFKEAICELSERERNILSMRFMLGKTQMEVASEIGISQAQVSRLEKNALDRIKKQM